MMPAAKNIIVNIQGTSFESEGQTEFSAGIIISISNIDDYCEVFDMRLYSAATGKELEWGVEENQDPKQIYIIGYKEDGGGD